MKKLLAFLMLGSCGCSAQEDVQDEVETLATKFEATYTNMKGEKKAVPTDKTLVVAYSASWCQPCQMEVKDWSKYLKSKDPKNVKIMTLSISDTAEQAVGWKNSEGASWEFGLANVDNFNKYCKPRAIPCLLVVKNGVVTFRHVGFMPHAGIEAYSGKWE